MLVTWFAAFVPERAVAFDATSGFPGEGPVLTTLDDPDGDIFDNVEDEEVHHRRKELYVTLKDCQPARKHDRFQ